MEARVGIGRFMPCFRTKNTLFLQQKQVTRPLQVHSGSNPLTEGFTETFTEAFRVHPSKFSISFFKRRVHRRRNSCHIAGGGHTLPICPVSCRMDVATTGGRRSNGSQARPKPNRLNTKVHHSSIASSNAFPEIIRRQLASGCENHFASNALSGSRDLKPSLFAEVFDWQEVNFENWGAFVSDIVRAFGYTNV